MLLGADHHAGPHEAHICDNLVCCEAIAVHEVCADQTASAAESGLAVHGNMFAMDIDGRVREVDEFTHQIERWTRPIVKDHVNVRDAEGGEVFSGIQVRIQADDKTNVAGMKVLENIAEGRWEGAGEYLLVSGGQHRLLLVRRRQRELRGREGEEVGRDPIEVPHVYPLEFLVPRCDISKRKRMAEDVEDTYSSKPNSRKFTIPFSLAFHTPYTTSCTFSTKSACEYPASRNGMSGGSHWARGDSAKCGGQLWTKTYSQ